MALNEALLKELLKQVQTDMLELKAKNELGEYTEWYNDVELDFSRYKENGGLGLTLGGKEPTPKITYYLKTKQDYIKKILDNFKDKVVEDEKDKIAILIDYYTDQLLRNNEGLGEAGIAKIVLKFIKELNDEPVTVITKLRLKGIFLPDDKPFLINEGKMKILLRKPNNEDFVAPIRPYFEPFKPEKVPTAILEITLEMKPSQLAEESRLGFDGLFILMNKLILLLRLFKQGDIIVIDRSVACESIRKLIFIANYAGFPNLMAPMFAKYSYGLHEKDYSNLTEFWSGIEKRILEYQDTRTKRKNIITSFGYDLYCDALNEQIPSGKRIAYAVMGLEGVYNSGSEATEISYKLRVRVGKVLSILARYDGKKTTDIIKVGYSIRSRFAHGAGVTINESEQKRITDCGFKSIDDFAQNLMEYLRISIILDIYRPHEPDDLFYRDLDYLLVKNENEEEFSNRYLKDAIEAKVW
jgi:hypothetical protein